MTPGVCESTLIIRSPQRVTNQFVAYSAVCFGPPFTTNILLRISIYYLISKCSKQNVTVSVECMHYASDLCGVQPNLIQTINLAKKMNLDNAVVFEDDFVFTLPKKEVDNKTLPAVFEYPRSIVQEIGGFS